LQRRDVDLSSEHVDALDPERRAVLEVHEVERLAQEVLHIQLMAGLRLKAYENARLIMLGELGRWRAKTSRPE